MVRCKDEGKVWRNIGRKNGGETRHATGGGYAGHGRRWCGLNRYARTVTLVRQTPTGRASAFIAGLQTSDTLPHGWLR